MELENIVEIDEEEADGLLGEESLDVEYAVLVVVGCDVAIESVAVEVKGMELDRL